MLSNLFVQMSQGRKKIIVPPPTGSGNNATILFGEDHFNAIKERVNAGPFRLSNDFENSNNPGDLKRIEDDANYFLNTNYNNVSIETAYFKKLNNHKVWNGTEDETTDNSSGYYTHVIQPLSAAYWYRLTGNVAYGNKVKEYLLAEYSEGAFYRISYLGDTKFFHTGGFVAKWATAYDLVKDLFSAAEKSAFLGYIKDIGYWYANGLHGHLSINFAGRLSGDWTPTGGNALDGDMTSSYAYFEIVSGAAHNQLSTLSQWYNNRRFSQYQAVLFAWAVLDGTEYQTEADDLLHHFKTYIKEFYQFGMFADGSLGEYARNGNYSTPFSGVTYGAINILITGLGSYMTALKGDFELWNYSTSNGLHGTAGGPKDLELLITTDLHLAASLLDWSAGGSTQAQRESNRLDRVSPSGTQWTTDNWCAPANMLIQSASLRDIYLRRHANMPKWPTGSEGTSGPVGSPYYNRAGTYCNVAAVLGFFGGFELSEYNKLYTP